MSTGPERVQDSNYSITPSREAAWFLGVMSGGGWVEQNRKRVGLDSMHRPLVQSLELVGKNILGVNSSCSDRPRPDYDGVRIIFYSSRLALALGDMSRMAWADTIRDRHGWIQSRDEYVWGFLEGLFEVNGNIYLQQRHSKKGIAQRPTVTYWNDSKNNINLLADLFTRVGINGLGLSHDKDSVDGVKGISLYRRSDIKVFADHVYSRVPEKEERLVICRQLSTKEQKGAPEYPTLPTMKSEEVNPKPDPREQLIAGYRRIRQVCLTEYGRLPTFADLLFLSKNYQSSFAFDIVKLFGNGSIVQARRNLEKIIQGI